MDKHIAELFGTEEEPWESIGPDEPVAEDDNEEPLIAFEDDSEIEAEVETPAQVCQSIDEFMNRQILPRDIFLESWLERGSLTVIGGEQKVGKSILALNLSISLASGKDYLGFKVCEPREVMLCQQEISDAAFRERIERMFNKTGTLSLPNLGLFKKPDGLLKVTNGRDRELLTREIEERRPDLVIFDPLSTFHSQDENGEREMAKVLDIFHELIQRYDIGILLIHHFAKPSLARREGGHRLRGHSILGDRPDSIIIMNKIAEKYKESRLEYPYECYAELQFVLRNDEAPDNIIIVRDPKILWYGRTDFYAGIGRKVSPEDIKHVVQHAGGSITLRELRGVFANRVSSVPFTRAVKEAMEKGYIDAVKLPGKGSPLVLKIKS